MVQLLSIEINKKKNAQVKNLREMEKEAQIIIVMHFLNANKELDF